MNFEPTRITAALAVAGACLLGSMPAHAADKASDAARSGTSAQPERMGSSDRANMKGWSNEKESLQAELKPGQNKAAYVKALNDRGYTLTSINTDKPDVVEYEVVKGKQSYEVQIDFDKAGMGSKVDVSTNTWRTDATKAAMSGKAVPAATRVEAGNEAYSDRARMKAWTGEKDKIEKSLALGRDKAYYDDQLRKLGYQVTSVNDAEKDYVEYEIVKGRDSFEVQIDFAANKAKKVDVTTNVWQSDTTERALAGAKR